MIAISRDQYMRCMSTLANVAVEALLRWCENVYYVTGPNLKEPYVVCIFPNYDRFLQWYDLYGKQSYFPFIHVRCIDDSVFVQFSPRALFMAMVNSSKWHVSTRGKLGIAGM